MEEYEYVRIMEVKVALTELNEDKDSGPAPQLFGSTAGT